MAFVVWACLFHSVGISDGIRGSMGSCFTTNHSSKQQCLVPRTSSLSRGSALSIYADCAKASRLDSLSAQQWIHHPCLPLAAHGAAAEITPNS